LNCSNACIPATFTSLGYGVSGGCTGTGGPGLVIIYY
jgi:hypothetical protein